MLVECELMVNYIDYNNYYIMEFTVYTFSEIGRLLTNCSSFLRAGIYCLYQLSWCLFGV